MSVSVQKKIPLIVTRVLLCERRIAELEMLIRIRVCIQTLVLSGKNVGSYPVTHGKPLKICGQGGERQRGEPVKFMFILFPGQIEQGKGEGKRREKKECLLQKIIYVIKLPITIIEGGDNIPGKRWMVEFGVLLDIMLY